MMTGLLTKTSQLFSGRVKYKPVDNSNRTHLEKLFESKGGPHNCWCMVWRNMNEGTDQSNKTDKKESLKSYVANQTLVGIVCYDNSAVIA